MKDWLILAHSVVIICAVVVIAVSLPADAPVWTFVALGVLLGIACWWPALAPRRARGRCMARGPREDPAGECLGLVFCTLPAGHLGAHWDDITRAHWTGLADHPDYREEWRP